MASKTQKTSEKTTEVTTDGRKPSEQALQAVDVAVGAVPTVAEVVRTTAETWTNSETRSQEIETLQKRVQTLRDPKTRTTELESLRDRFGSELRSELQKAETKGGDVRRQVTDQLVGQARKARERVEPVYRDRVQPVVKERVEPVYRERVEPVVKERVEPIYRDRVEPTVKKVRERI